MKSFGQVALTSSNLPIVVIQTNGQAIVDEPKITANMGIIDHGLGVRNQASDAWNHYNGAIGIEVRGNSSQYLFPMKSYSVELRDAMGVDFAQPLLGMPTESDWVLYAPYTDKTLMRNFLAYSIARDLGHWAARGRFVELVLNGEYKGIYLLEEKIKRDNGRVNIAKLTTADTLGNDLTGGYIFSIDHRPNGWVSKYPVVNNNPQKLYRIFSYVYPEIEDLRPIQKAYLPTFVDLFETSLNASNFSDPQLGFRKYADESSFIDFLIVNEIAKNVDGYRLSSYFHKDKDSKNPKIKAGPVWDFDLAFRNAEYCDGDKMIGWAYDFNYVCANDWAQVPFWWSRFMQDDRFVENLWCRWSQLRKTTLSTQRILNRIDSVASVLQEAQGRHFTKWNILGKYVWPNPQPFAKTYQEEVGNLKEWLSGRLSWMDDNFVQKGPCFANLQPGKIDLVIQPNPVRSNALARITSAEEVNYSIRIIDLMGRTVSNKRGFLNIGTNDISMPVGHLLGGMYFLAITADNGAQMTKPFIK